MIGDMFTVNDAAQEAFAAGKEMGVGPEGVLVSFFGFPTLPKPVPAGPTGHNRLPKKLNLQWAGHPVLWLDEDRRLQRPGESEQEWSVRLYLELIVRGYMQEEPDGVVTWTDALLVDDIDVEEDPEAITRIQNWIRGEPDQKLDTLKLDNGELDAMGGTIMLDWEAKRLWLVYEQAWLQWARDSKLQAMRLVTAAQALFTPPGQWDTMFESWNSTLGKWAADPNNQQLRFGLVEEAQVLESRITIIQQHRAALSNCTANRELELIKNQLQQEAELVRDQGRSQELRGQVLRGDKQAAKDLNIHLHQWLQREVKAGISMQQQGIGPQWVAEQQKQLEDDSMNIARMLGEIGAPPNVIKHNNKAERH